MKRPLLATSLLLAVPMALGAQTVAGTPHDLSGGGYGTDEVCIFCHTPHNASASLPLWNHASSGETFTMYTSATIDETISGSPQGISLMCLSCHDGATNIDAFGGGAGTATIGTAGDVGIDLSDDHPISVTMTNADGGFVGTSPTTLPLYSARVECASCHNAHDNTQGAFLRMSNSASALCLDCHSK